MPVIARATAETEAKPEVAKVGLVNAWVASMPPAYQLKNPDVRRYIETGIYALHSLAYRKLPSVQVADNIGLPTDEGLFGFKPFPEVCALTGYTMSQGIP